MSTPAEPLGPVAALQDIRTVIDEECQALLEAAEAYERNAHLLLDDLWRNNEIHRLLKLAKDAREKEANLRQNTQWRTDLC